MGVKELDIEFYTFSIEYIFCTYPPPNQSINDRGRTRKTISFISSFIFHGLHLHLLLPHPIILSLSRSVLHGVLDPCGFCSHVYVCYWLASIYERQQAVFSFLRLDSSFSSIHSKSSIF